MVTKKGTIESEKYNESPVIPGNKKVWFLNGDLVRLYHSSRSTGLVSVYNINKDRVETCLRTDFRKNRERAYTVTETAKLINRHRKYMPKLMKTGMIPKPIDSFGLAPIVFVAFPPIPTATLSIVLPIT